MTSRPARPRTLLDFINRPILKGVAPAGNLKRVFTGKSGQNRKKNFGRVMYASETIQNCKNPTGHIDTLSVKQCSVCGKIVSHRIFSLPNANKQRHTIATASILYAHLLSIRKYPYGAGGLTKYGYINFIFCQ